MYSFPNLESVCCSMFSPKGNQPWLFIGRSDAEAETPILWPPDAKNWLIWKDPDAGKIEGSRKGQQRMRWLDGITIGHEFEQAPGVGDGQGSLECAVHGVTKSQTRLSNWTELVMGSLLKLLVLPPDPLPPMWRDPGSLPCVRKPFSSFFLHFFCDAYSVQFLYNALLYYNRICSP